MEFLQKLGARNFMFSRLENLNDYLNVLIFSFVCISMMQVLWYTTGITTFIMQYTHLGSFASFDPTTDHVDTMSITYKWKHFIGHSNIKFIYLNSKSWFSISILLPWNVFYFCFTQMVQSFQCKGGNWWIYFWCGTLQ